MKRRDFLATSACALIAAAPSTIDWTFSGVLGAYAQRLDSQTPFASFHADWVMPAASTIKLLVLLAAAKQMERREFSWTHEVTLRASQIVGASESFGDAQPGHRATLQALARACIAQSDNTAANVLLDWTGFAEVNALAQRLGFEATRMRRHFMDFTARERGLENTTTAREMALLARGIALGSVDGYGGVSAAGCKQIVGFMREQEDREEIPAAARGESVANKTGELASVRHDVAIVGLGTPSAYTVALLAMDFASRSAAITQLRAVAAQIDARAQGALPK